MSVSVDLMSHVPTKLKKAGVTHGGEYHGPCPWCGGEDRFIVNPNFDDGKGKWWCRKCGRWGNGVGFIMQYHGKTFDEALEYLGVERLKPAEWVKKHEPATHVRTTPEDDGKLFNTEEWQRGAEQFVNRSIDTLESSTGAAARRYLESRGIPRFTGSFMLGFNPESGHEMWGSQKVWLPKGIVIPWEYKNQYWRVRIRRSPADLKPGDDKYQQPTGCGNGLYGVQHVRTGDVVVMVEGEFDKLLLDAHIRRARINNVVVVATGGTNNGRLLRWVSLLSIASLVLLAFDDDEIDEDTYTKAGDMAAFWWQAALKVPTKRLRPTHHDITDMWKAGVNLVKWLVEGINE